ncbi:MAG: hypothetical protein J6I79_03805 [Paludibacteraceae bacterium]|nr:hypothetical protein [Paludibacteraceae bacterium]
MPYTQIVKLRQMRPAYNIKEESSDEWKTFIANDQFNDILKKTIKAVRNNDADNHKSVWIAGTYGTGKSHAGSVIKHLLCDDLNDIRDYIEEEYSKPKYDVLKTELYELRQTKRLFPVNLYGQQSISHEEDLSLQMQREIKRSLKNAGIDITVKTDFDMYIQHIENDDNSFWKNLIKGNAQLASVTPDVEKLKSRLNAADTDVLSYVRDALRKGGYEIRLQSNNLKQWILEVQAYLREHTYYNGLLLIWDEFTEIMTCGLGTRLLVQLQELSEAMMNPENDSYFLLISHPSALNTLRDDEREKTKGRYHYVSYNMEPVSAFRIMSKKFEIVNVEKYNQRQNRFFNVRPEILDVFCIGSNNDEETKDNIRNLFPLHPGTANLATYYAREAGSSSRSVFEFLASDAIRDFLDKEENFDSEKTITADYLWDYVKEYFESDSTKFGAVTERYNSHHLTVESKGESYSKVFKGILLLNALNNIANSDSVTPSTENITNLFVGTEIENELSDILDFFNDKSIIQRQPNGNFSILFTALPGDEIQKIKEELKASTFLYTDRVIKFDDTATKFFDNNLSQVLRPKNFKFFSLQGNEPTLMNQIENAKKQAKSYETFLAFMVGKNSQEVGQLKDIVERNSKDERYKEIAFVVMETPFGEKEYERYIEYQANAKCAQSHGLPTQHQTYTAQAGDMIKEWVTKMKSNNATFYLNNDSLTVSGSKLTSTINSTIAPRIFNKGPESLTLISTKSTTTYWNKASVKATVDAVLSYPSKQDILESCKGNAKHVHYLMQDSIDDNLVWKDNVDANHPLKLVNDYVDEWLSGKHTDRNRSFNLGEKLIGLSKAPYGLFQSYAPMAMVAFALRKYVNILFDTNGKPRTTQHLVEDVVEMFKAWENGTTSNKLNFMFEGKEAGKVCKMLIDSFSLNKLKGYSDISSLKDARWAVTNVYCKEKGFPLWSLKYSGVDNPELVELIDNIVKVVTDPDSSQNVNLLNSTIVGHSKLSFDFRNLLLPTEDNFKKGFYNFLKQDKQINIKDEELDNALAYIKGHLQGEIGTWKEDSVNRTISYWRIEELNKTASQNNGNQSQVETSTDTISAPNGGNIQNGQSIQGNDTPEEMKELRNNALSKIRENANLQSAIEELIKAEGRSVIEILMKYV